VSTIVQEQNSDLNLRLLCAQSCLYSRAKRTRAWHTSVVVFIALLSPLFLAMPDAVKITTGILGGIVTLGGVLMEMIETAQLKQAATVQEEFDTNLFKLPWNRIAVGNKVDAEIIRAADRRFKGDRGKKCDWYPDPRPLPYPLDVLVCQRANLVWDSQLRRAYGSLLVVSTIL
jgi:hypothetical protein